MNEPQTEAPRHVLCPACGKMSCEHLAAELEQLRARVHEFETGAIAVLNSTSQLGVPEEAALHAVSSLAKLVGFDLATPPSTSGMPPPRANDVDRMQHELVRLANLLEVEVKQTPGWTFGLFVYEDRQDAQLGHVLAISRDRTRTMRAVASWLKASVTATKATAKG